MNSVGKLQFTLTIYHRATNFLLTYELVALK